MWSGGKARVGLSFVMKIMTNVELMSSVSMGVCHITWLHGRKENLLVGIVKMLFCVLSYGPG